ncbi:MAG: vitamin B12-dependent ribonucleotide reductase [Deltaproteobacteria bacterium]|nr:vitamin B12-dependent ribonucleotide reductase [Deltaproteobacteria bacterium]
MLKAKLKEHGIENPTRIPLDKSLFIRNGLEISQNAHTVLERRYLRKDSNGRIIEAPGQMFSRVARYIAEAEIQYNEAADATGVEETFYELMTSLRFLPNSPTLMNAGRSLGQLSACFVLPVEDSLDGIFSTLSNAAMIHKSGGGTGFSFSRLRPKNSMVGTTGGVASGPVSFMKIFNTATEQIKQGGTRRGANMAVLRVDHPDIMEFITCKKAYDDLNNFNISVGLDETFMAAVKDDDRFALVNPCDGNKVSELDAAAVYKTLIENAWESGDPGIVFLDRINRDNPTPRLGEIESTNPCGEQPLLPMEACNLGSINLAKFVDADMPNGPAIDYEALKQTVHMAVRFLDNTIDMCRFPLPEIDAMVKGNRKIGLGVMGFADLLFQLKIPYDSEAALEAAESVMGLIQKESHSASTRLAAERGSFLNHDRSVFAGRNGDGRRNATTTTIAPTGTLSIIADCSSGIEPLFALSFVRNVMDDDTLTEVNPYFEAIARERGFYSEELMDRIATCGSIQDIDSIPADVRSVFVTSHDISPEWHVRMQAAFQKHTDNAVSKTVNLSHNATVEDVRRVYDLAYELGCKGVTIYRDGSKSRQVLSFKNGATTRNEVEDRISAAVRSRPETLQGFTTRIKTGMGQLYVTVTEYDGQPFEVFATIGKSGRSATAKTEAIGRLASLALRSGVNVAQIVEQLKGIGGEHPVFQEGGLVLSIPDAISRVLEKHYLGDTPKAGHGISLKGESCPECGRTISFEEGCKKCHSCGFTECG